MGRVDRSESRSSADWFAARLVDRDVPFRLRRGQRAGFHPGREALVQPEVVPPPHGDEIAEPLVGHLVRDGGGDVLACRDRRRRAVGEQSRFTVEDRRRVLHRAGREVGHRDHVELSERVIDGVVVVEIGQDLLRRFQRDVAEMLLARRRADANRRALGAALQALEVADGHRHEIRRHPRRGRELHRVLRRPRAWRVGDDPAVRDGDVAAVDRQREREGGLVRRLVKAGEGPPRIRRLELRDGVIPSVRFADVEPAKLVVQDAAVPDVDVGRPRRPAASSTVKRCGLGARIERDGRVLRRRRRR